MFFYFQLTQDFFRFRKACPHFQINGVKSRNSLRSALFLAAIFLFYGQKIIAQPCNPAAVFSLSNISAARCHNQSITFTNPNSLSGQYRFRFFNSANVQLAGPVAVAASNGTVNQSFPSGTGYKAVLIRQDVACKDSIIVNFNVDAIPTVPVFTHNGPQCANATTEFTVTGPLAGHTYNWNFGDPGSGANNTASGTTASHAFSIAPDGLDASYGVFLKVTSPLGCLTNGAVTSIQVKATPNINLTDPNFLTQNIWKRCQQDANSVDSSYTFKFRNQSLGSVGTNYKFIWGDSTPNTTSAQGSLPETITHLYSFFGVKNGSLTATDPNGCISTFAFKVVNEKFPSASLSIPPAQVSICDGNTVTIFNNSLNATSYTWHWGDGDSLITTSKAPQSHQYSLDDSVACKITTASGRKFDLKLMTSNTCYNHENTSPIYVRPLPRIDLDFDTLVCIDPATGVAAVPFGLYVCPNRMMATDFTLTTIIFNDPLSTPTNPDSIVFNPNVPLNNISHSFAPGVYTIATKAKNHCGTTLKSKQLTVCVNTDVLAKRTASEPEIFPNPIINNEFRIRWAGPVVLHLRDMLGKVISTECRSDSQGEHIFHLQNLPSGLYSAEIYADGRRFSRKIIK